MREAIQEHPWIEQDPVIPLCYIFCTKMACLDNTVCGGAASACRSLEWEDPATIANCIDCIIYYNNTHPLSLVG